MENAAADKKAALAEKLAIEREARAEDRQIARESRAEQRLATTPDPSNTDFVQEDGAWFERVRSGTGAVLEKKLAPQNKIDELNLDRDKKKLSIEELLAKTAVAKRDLEEYDTDKSLERRVKESQIDRNRDTGLAATIRAGNSSSSGKAPASLSEAADLLVGKYPDLVKQVSYAPAGDEPLLTPAEVQRVATESVKIAAQRGQDAAAIFQDALRRRANSARKASDIPLDLGL
jgi:hypothetical protein